jgi:hypothetical protein
MEERFNPNSGALSAARRRIKRASGIQRRIENITGLALGEMLSASGSGFAEVEEVRTGELDVNNASLV